MHIKASADLNTFVFTGDFCQVVLTKDTLHTLGSLIVNLIEGCSHSRKVYVIKAIRCLVGSDVREDTVSSRSYTMSLKDAKEIADFAELIFKQGTTSTPVIKIGEFDVHVVHGLA